MMERTYQIYLITCLVNVFLLCCGYYALFYLQFNTPIEASYWVRDEAIFKQYLATSIKTPKIIIASGSNGLYGINSKILEDYTGTHMPVVNIAIHAGMPLDWLLNYTKEIAKKGDIVILPLESAYYVLGFLHPSNWTIEQVAAWNKEYFYSLNFFRKLQFVCSERIDLMVNHIITKIRREATLKENPERKLGSVKEILNNYFSTPRPSEFQYSYLNNNRQGDLLNTCQPDTNISQIKKADYGSTLDLKWVNFLFLKMAIHSMEKKGVKVFVTFHPMVKNSITQSDAFNQYMGRITHLLSQLNISILGKPSDYLIFDPNDFLDSEYHLNCHARDIRSKILGMQLKEALKKLPSYNRPPESSLLLYKRLYLSFRNGPVQPTKSFIL